MSIHLIKLVVGVDTLDEFAQMQDHYGADRDGQKVHAIWTRHKPKRAEDLIAGGSAYRVIKNRIVCRQKIIGFEEASHPQKGKMCVILMEPKIIRTAALARRPFQGWRYLQPADAPPDIGEYTYDDEAGGSEEIGAELEALGLI